MTPELKAVTDLRHQFDGFLVRLPAQSLTRDFEWANTNTIVNGEPTAEHSRMVSIVRYRVLSDTTMNGERRVVVRMVQDQKLEAGGPVDGKPLKAESILTGRDLVRLCFQFQPDECWRVVDVVISREHLRTQAVRSQSRCNSSTCMRV